MSTSGSSHENDDIHITPTFSNTPPNPEQLCANCNKPSENKCSKCHQIPYCSRDCRRSDWNKHKKQCSKLSAEKIPNNIPTPPPQPSTGNRKKSKSKSDYGDPLHLNDLPTDKVFEILIDVYRLHIEDVYVCTGEAIGLYGGKDPMEGFREFLDLAESLGPYWVLPKWWSKGKRLACERLGRRKGGWSELACAVESSDIQEHYKDPVMLLQLRFIAELVYGSGVMDD